MINANFLASARTNAVTGGRRSVLIADPDFERASNIIENLFLDGYDVSPVRSVGEALHVIGKQRFDYGLLELKFADGDGFRILEILTAYDPTPRIVFHSRYCDVACAVRAIKAGAADMLPKPVNVDLILAILLGNDLKRMPSLDVLPSPNAIRKEHIKSVIESCNSNITRAASQLSMHRRTLMRFMERHDIARPQSGHGEAHLMSRGSHNRLLLR
jgi:two-component system, response regulator RegA